jgi:hypothetical protein
MSRGTFSAIGSFLLRLLSIWKPTSLSKTAGTLRGIYPSSPLNLLKFISLKSDYIRPHIEQESRHRPFVTQGEPQETSYPPENKVTDKFRHNRVSLPNKHRNPIYHIVSILTSEGYTAKYVRRWNPDSDNTPLSLISQYQDLI